VNKLLMEHSQLKICLDQLICIMVIFVDKVIVL
jgi:hypothetical protein